MNSLEIKVNKKGLSNYFSFLIHLKACKIGKTTVYFHGIFILKFSDFY